MHGFFVILLSRVVWRVLTFLSGNNDRIFSITYRTVILTSKFGSAFNTLFFELLMSWNSSESLGNFWSIPLLGHLHLFHHQYPPHLSQEVHINRSITIPMVSCFFYNLTYTSLDVTVCFFVVLSSLLTNSLFQLPIL